MWLVTSMARWKKWYSFYLLFLKCYCLNTFWDSPFLEWSRNAQRSVICAYVLAENSFLSFLFSHHTYKWRSLQKLMLSSHWSHLSRWSPSSRGPRDPRTEKIHPNFTLFQVLIYSNCDHNVCYFNLLNLDQFCLKSVVSILWRYYNLLSQLWLKIWIVSSLWLLWVVLLWII